jgi:hypothetical protein
MCEVVKFTVPEILYDNTIILLLQCTILQFRNQAFRLTQRLSISYNINTIHL